MITIEGQKSPLGGTKARDLFLVQGVRHLQCSKHGLSPAGIRKKGSGGYCKTCLKERQKAWKRRLRQKDPQRYKSLRRADSKRRAERNGHVYKPIPRWAFDVLFPKPRWVRPTPVAKEERAAKARIGSYQRYWSNPEQHRNRKKIYKHSNPERMREWAGKRWGLIRQQCDGTLTKPVVRSIFTQSRSCEYCSNPMREGDKTLDHVVPVSRGGLHSIFNVVIACRKCNSSKGSKLIGEWAMGQHVAPRVATVSMGECKDSNTGALYGERGRVLVCVGACGNSGHGSSLDASLRENARPLLSSSHTVFGQYAV